MSPPAIHLSGIPDERFIRSSQTKKVNRTAHQELSIGIHVTSTRTKTERLIFIQILYTETKCRPICISSSTFKTLLNERQGKNRWNLRPQPTDVQQKVERRSSGNRLGGWREGIMIANLRLDLIIQRPLCSSPAAGGAIFHFRRTNRILVPLNSIFTSRQPFLLVNAPLRNVKFRKKMKN